MRVFRAGIAVLLLASPALGQERCLLRDATYKQAGSDYVLQFLPVPHDASTSIGGRFEIRGLENGRVVSGEVVFSSGYGGPMTALSVECLEQGNDQPASCVVWENFIYVLGDQAATLLPRDDEAAPQVILLPGFGRLVHDRLTTDIGHLPADVFSFAECAP